MRGRRREPRRSILQHPVRVDVVWCLDLRADAAPDLCAQQPEPDAASQRAPDAASDLRSQPAPDSAPQRAPGAAANVAAQPAADAHALVSKKDAAADPSAIAAPYT